LLHVRVRFENHRAGVETKIVSLEGFTPNKCRRFCSCQSTRLQQRSTDFNKQAAIGSTAITWNQQNSTDFNRVWNLVRDQGVGGSNPLSPTNFNELRVRLVFPPQMWAFLRAANSSLLYSFRGSSKGSDTGILEPLSQQRNRAWRASVEYQMRDVARSEAVREARE